VRDSSPDHRRKMLRVWNGQVNESRTHSSPHRQTKVKNRPVPQLAGDPETSAVGFYDGFADRQSQAGSVDLHALVSSAVEFGRKLARRTNHAQRARGH
jgi:hypothetical protein